MKVKLDPGAYMPVRAHEQDAGYDLELVDDLPDSDRGSAGYGSTGR